MKQGSIKYKVIIDTNILISFLIGKALKGLPTLLDQNKISIITTDEQIKEFIAVVSRKKFQKYFSRQDIEEFLRLFEEKSQIVELKTKQDICRDPKDNYLISLAVDSKSDFLITGDKDIIILKKIGQTEIISYTDFYRVINKNK